MSILLTTPRNCRGFKSLCSSRVFNLNPSLLSSDETPTRATTQKVYWLSQEKNGIIIKCGHQHEVTSFCGKLMKTKDLSLLEEQVRGCD